LKMSEWHSSELISNLI